MERGHPERSARGADDIGRPPERTHTGPTARVAIATTDSGRGAEVNADGVSYNLPGFLSPRGTVKPGTGPRTARPGALAFGGSAIKTGVRVLLWRE